MNGTQQPVPLNYPDYKSYPTGYRTPPSQDYQEKKKRPRLITFLCILGFFGGFYMIIRSVLAIIILTTGIIDFSTPIFSEVALTPAPLWYHFVMIISSLLEVILLILIWNMKRRGVVLYTSLVILTNVFGFFTAEPAERLTQFIFAIISLVVLGLFYSQFKKMD